MVTRFNLPLISHPLNNNFLQLQFFARCLSGLLRENPAFSALASDSENFAARLEAFWRGMLDARRLHWFGKSLAELRTVETTLATLSLPMEVRYAHAMARLGFAVRWAIENAFILVKLKVTD